MAAPYRLSGSRATSNEPALNEVPGERANARTRPQEATRSGAGPSDGIAVDYLALMSRRTHLETTASSPTATNLRRSRALHS